MNLRYGSVCSGIEAASTAWEPLGWKPAWFSEIESFPSAVLANHWPEVTNLGDMTKIAAAVRAGEIEAPDLLVGGTPCQAFSVAGLRKGLNDSRGQLTLSYVDLANAIDEKRIERGSDEAILVWENVPGVLSDSENAFGCFLAGLVGEDEPIEPGERPATGKSNRFWRWNKKTSKHVASWSLRGCIYGRQRALAWCVRDAQYYGVAQRRRRVFVVASARSGFDPASVLFEFDGVRRDTPPSREAGQEVANYAGNRAENGSHWDSPGNPHPTLNQSNNTGGIGMSNQEVFSQRGSGLVSDVIGTLAAHSFTGGAGGRPEGAAAGHFIPVCVTGDITHTLKDEGFDGSEDGTGRGTPVIVMAHGQSGAEIRQDDAAPTLTCNHESPIAAYAFKGGQGAKAGGIGWAAEQSPTLTSAGSGSNLAPTVAIAIAGNTIGRAPENGGNGAGYSVEIGYTLTKTDQHGVAIAYVGFDVLGTPASEIAKGTDIHTPLRARVPGQFENSTVTMVSNGMTVRRLTPRECERLQGFPDDHTLIPYGRRISPEKMDRDFAKYLMRGGNLTFEECCGRAADGPRYKAIGNSMAVPVMRWIGEQIVKEIAKMEEVIETAVELDTGVTEAPDTPERKESAYVTALKTLRAQPVHYLKEVGDQWRSPDLLVWGINALFGPLVLDLFADDSNTKCPAWYTAEDNALTQDWSAALDELGGAAFANPPYSRSQYDGKQPVTGMRHIMNYVATQREKGGRYVFLIKAATSEVWWPENADHVAFIRGRIGFDLPDWFNPADEKQKPAGAFFAGAIAVFDKTWRGERFSYIDREELEEKGRAFMALAQFAVARHPQPAVVKIDDKPANESVADQVVDARVWPMEVELLFNSMPGVVDLNARQQEDLKVMINQWWLERFSSDEIMSLSGTAMVSMKGVA